MSNIATLGDEQVERLANKLMKKLVVDGELNIYARLNPDEYSEVYVAVAIENNKFNISTSYSNIINEFHDLVYARIESFHAIHNGVVAIKSDRSALLVKPEYVSAFVVLSENESEEEQFAKPLSNYTLDNNFIRHMAASFTRPKYMYDYIRNALAVNIELERRLKIEFES